MSESDRKIWTAVLAHLRENTPALCRKWFEDIEPLGIQGGAMDLCTTQNAHRDYLAGKCVDAFNDAFQHVTGHLVSVRFLGPQETAESRGRTGTASKAVGATTDANGAATAIADPPDDRNGSVQTTGPRRPAMSAASAMSPMTHSSRRAAGDIALEADYTFDSFVQGPNNRLAHAAAMAICEKPGQSYNPFFVHGGSGLGKTHLLQAVCHRIIETTPSVSILYISCEGFTNRFFEALQSQELDRFKNRFRDVDVLVIDDIHFLTKRERSQEEFFHTFNALHQARKQIILASDRLPADIPGLEERLVSRFLCGLVAPIDPPDYETRVEIVRSKARMRGAEFPDDVCALIAARIDSNVRELEGKITSIQMQASVDHRPIDIALAREILGVTPTRQPRPGAGVTIQAIVDAVTEHFNVNFAALQSKRRQRSIAEPRQICMYFAREYTRFSLEEIGSYFGGRDHTTVLHAVRTIAKRRESDEHLAAAVDHIRSRLAGDPPLEAA
ncbi:MAG: chromosomal replication initiator protein DnaA [Phycisphaeraceae bacterium]|nr:chromosomal replication initiator protein DnaA [Phycisphaeraceae bacterium]MCB9847154.1 chromosomal replication initiator protein DnaA [Phycisphaeraceae bacterium]